MLEKFEQNRSLTTQNFEFFCQKTGFLKIILEDVSVAETIVLY